VKQTIMSWVTHYGYPGIFSLLMLGIAGLPVPDETLLTFTGYLVYTGRLDFVPALLSAFAGSICGITLSYVLGRTFGIALIHRYGRYLGLTEKRILEAHNWFERAGRWGLTFGYYIPGVRHFTAYAAGMSDLEPHIFALFAYSGGMLWSLSFISLGYYLGERWESVSEEMHRQVTILCVAVAVLAVVFLFIRKRWRKKPAKNI
jgi:membrane protein DedA with SNARE-associated domain